MASKVSWQHRLEQATYLLQAPLDLIEGIKAELEECRDSMSAINLEKSELFSCLEETVQTVNAALDQMQMSGT